MLIATSYSDGCFEASMKSFLNPFTAYSDFSVALRELNIYGLWGV